MEVTEGALDLYIDCSGTIKCFRDEAFATCASQARAHMWTRTHEYFADTLYTLHKVKAHATLADVESGLISHWERRGNQLADTHAKMGAALHIAPLHELDPLLIIGLNLIIKEASVWGAIALAAYVDMGYHTDAVHPNGDQDDGELIVDFGDGIDGPSEGQGRRSPPSKSEALQPGEGFTPSFRTPPPFRDPGQTSAGLKGQH